MDFLLLVLSGTAFLEGLDGSMIGVALPAIRADLEMTTGGLQWVVSAYVLGFGGFVLIGGRAADILGRRRVFVVSLWAFVILSGACGLALEGWMLIVARFLTGISAGFLAPAGLSLITSSYPEGPSRDRAVLFYAAASGAGFSLGLVIGGLLATFGWRWVFLAPAFVGGAILIGSLRFVPKSATRSSQAHVFDVAGGITVTAAMLLFVFTVVTAPDTRLTVTASLLASCAALLLLFVGIERRSAAPLMRFQVLNNGRRLRANLGALLFIGSFAAFQFVTVLYLQELRGWSPLETGLALLIVGLDAVLAPTLTPRLLRRFSTTSIIATGMVLASCAYALFLRLDENWSYGAMLPTFVLIGLAFALTYGALAIAATDGVDESDQGLAGGMLNVSVQFGAALGFAAAAAVNVAATSGTPTTAELIDGYRTALLVAVAAAVLGVLVSLSGSLIDLARRC